MTSKRLHITAPALVLALVVVAVPVTAKPAAASMTPEQHKAAVKQRVTAIHARVAVMKADHQAKLADKRLEVCNKRTEKINQIVGRSVEQSRKNLAVFSSIEQRVEDFYASKQLSADDYVSLTDAADQKKADAEAALQVAAETEFSCDQTNPARPGEIVKNLMQSQHRALKDYRTAVKNLIVGVKHALGDKNSDQAASADPKHETEPTNTVQAQTSREDQ
ncbi:MAG TPA: hypothetical protein VFK03_01960 [Candidatus Saccharimonadales bacterium]|nr:hypothetical protein [Candidatus Saccharimonadales bacterium]